jgi:hypothetical protein
MILPEDRHIIHQRAGLDEDIADEDGMLGRDTEIALRQVLAQRAGTDADRIDEQRIRPRIVPGSPALAAV